MATTATPKSDIQVQNDSNMKNIVAMMLVGKKYEPFLGACLESISDAYDYLIVNDNSRGKCPENREVLESSRLFADGRMSIIESDFIGFAGCRNLCIDHILEEKMDCKWLSYIDSDEVHTNALHSVTRGILPRLPDHIGIVESFTYNFFQSLDYFNEVSRRYRQFVRFSPAIRWHGDVHEKLEGTAGKKVSLPYRYFHYGYLADKNDVDKKQQLYASLGDQTTKSQLGRFDDYVHGQLEIVMPYTGKHPAVALDALNMIIATKKEYFHEFESRIPNDALSRLKRRARLQSVELRILFRTIGTIFSTRSDLETARKILGLWKNCKY